MRLPEENGADPCAGEDDRGLASTGMHLGADAVNLLNASTIRVLDVDANRTGVPSTTLSGYGMTGYGSGATDGTRKIDHLFARGGVHSSPVGYTVASTRSNHMALYSFIDF